MRRQQHSRSYLRPASMKTLMDKKAATAVVITGADLPTDMATAGSLKRLHIEPIGLYKNKKSTVVRVLDCGTSLFIWERKPARRVVQRDDLGAVRGRGNRSIR